MSNTCQQMSNSDGTCNCAWIDSGYEDRNGDTIYFWDSEDFCCDPYDGYCNADDSEFPGDLCSSYQPDLAGDYCECCGEYLGYGDDENDDDYEESECRCDD